MNRMAGVAALFNKKIGEVFKVRAVTGKILECKFSNKYLWYSYPPGDSSDWETDNFVSNTLLVQLIRGEAEIIDE